MRVPFLLAFLVVCCADTVNPSVACVKAGGQWVPENGCHAAYCTQAPKKTP